MGRNRKAKILFMGTPEFAVASLGALLMNGFNVVGVVSAPDKKAGRGRKIRRSAVAEYAISNYLNLLQPANLKDPDFIREVNSLKPDIAVVVAFRMIPASVWKIPKFGTFNLHASLLPQYRGAAPINHAVINGETTTGVTTFLIDDKIDTGNILLRESIHISKTENAGDLHNTLMRMGAKLTIETVELLISGKIEPQDQNQFIRPGEILKTAPKLFSADCFVDWNRRSETVYNLIRGLAPYPGARTLFSNKRQQILIKILESKYYKETHNYTPGMIISDGKNNLHIYTGDGYIEVLRLQPEGKREMLSGDYLRGVNIKEFSVVTDLQA